MNAPSSTQVRANSDLPKGVLTRRIAGAHRAQNHALLGQGLLLGAFAVFGLLCLALASGAEDLHGDPLWIAVSGGLFVAFLWFFEERQPRAVWARRLDRRLNLRGGLMAGLQAEQRDPMSSMGRLLVDELLPKTERKRVLRLGISLHLWLVALPFLSGAFLVQSVKSKRGPDTQWQTVAPLLQGLQDDLQAAIERAYDVAPATREQVAGLHSVSNAVRQLALQEELGNQDAEAWAAEVERIAQSVHENALDLPRDRVLDQALEAAQNRLDLIEERARAKAGLPAKELARANPESGPNPSSEGAEGDGSDAQARVEGAADAPDRDANPSAGDRAASGELGSQAQSLRPTDPAQTTRSSGTPPGGADGGASAASPNLAGATETTPIDPFATPTRLKVGPAPPKAYRGLIQRWLDGETPR